MSIAAKAMLLNGLEHDLSDKVTAADMATMLSVLSDRLVDYSIEVVDHGPELTDDLQNAYFDALRIEGKSPKTIERYRYIIGRMMTAIKTPTRNITVYHLRQYLAAEKARGISDRTLESTRQVFSAYFNWLQREGLIESNPCANLGVIKFAKKQKDIYSEADIERMKFGCKTLRDRAIIAFLKSTGCRISEMCNLNRNDVDLNALECTVLGKGNKERTVFLDQVTAMTLQNYLDTRMDDYPALFVGKGSDRMKPGGVRKMLVQLGETSHVDHVHPHKFRRTTATSLIRHGMPIQEVAMILGHDKLDTTMQYVVLDKSDVKNSYRKYA